jgi:hypothetical protein
MHKNDDDIISVFQIIAEVLGGLFCLLGIALFWLFLFPILVHILSLLK